MPKLRVKAYTPTFIQVSDRQLHAVGHGIRKCGDDFEFTDDLSKPADVALIVSGPKYPGSRLHAAREAIHKRFGERLLVSETPLFRRGAQPHEGPDPYFRLSVGGFMRDDGAFHPQDFKVTNERWLRISQEQGIQLRPWCRGGRGDYILVCMQKPSDASLRGLSVHDWTVSTVSKIREITYRPIVIRPHPLDKTRAGVHIRTTGVTWSQNKFLEDDLSKAFALVSYTSLSAIESVIEGLPTFCLNPGNHAWPVSLKDDLDALRRAKPLADPPCRESWIHGLAWSQWKLSELREGRPWRRLRPLLLS